MMEAGFEFKESRIQRYQKERSVLENERASFLPVWRDLGDYILPQRYRAQTSDTNRGDRRNLKILNGFASSASDTLSAGMVSGITSAARRWFRVTTPDPDLAEFPKVKDWLHLVTERMTSKFLLSNFYSNVPTVYGDLGTFGTAALLVEPDVSDTFRCYSLPLGSFSAANNDRLQIDVVNRDLRMSVRNIIKRFGKTTASGLADRSNFSATVLSAFDRGEYETQIDVCHRIGPNEDYRPKSPFARFKAYSSCYYEKGSSGAQPSNDRLLNESGYDYFPVLVPRWKTSGEDAYGTDCPGIQSIGDVKGLQFHELRKAELIDKLARPPMKGPPELMDRRVSQLPGDMTYVNEREASGGLRPLYEVTPNTEEISLSIDRIERRIDRYYKGDVLRMFSDMNRSGVTATEIDAKSQEKLIELGPVYTQLNQDMLDPCVGIVFQLMVERGEIPPPPEELRGQPLKIEYESIMAQAQKIAGLAGVERFTNFVGMVVKTTGDMSKADVVNFDELIATVGDITSQAPRIIRTDEELAAMREQRARQQAQAVAAQNAKDGAGAAKTLSETDLGRPSALTELLRMSQAGALGGLQDAQ